MLPFGTQVRGFKPGRSRQIFQVEKILSAPSFGGEVKPSVPCRKLRHVKEPKSPPSATGVRSRRFRRWRCLVARVGTF